MDGIIDSFRMFCTEQSSNRLQMTIAQGFTKRLRAKPRLGGFECRHNAVGHAAHCGYYDQYTVALGGLAHQCCRTLDRVRASHGRAAELHDQRFQLALLSIPGKQKTHSRSASASGLCKAL